MRLVLGLMLLPSFAHAECARETLLSCPVAGSQKQIEMCLDGDQITYSYGRPGQPELELSEPLADGTYTPWNGIGRSMWDAVAFYNEGYTYTVNWSVDRMDENLPVEAGVTVDKGGSIVAMLNCADGSVGPEFGAVLLGAMEGLGLCWDPTALVWSKTCGN